jgi:ribonucleoside-diphosphate reductase alpha chain
LDYLSFDDRLELGLASIDDMPEAQTSLLTDDQSVDGQLVEATEHPVMPDVEKPAVVEVSASVAKTPTSQSQPAKASPVAADSTAPLCYNCGNQTQRAGSCYVCTSCGSTTGCS